MPLKVCIYEDDRFAQFYPLTFLRPVYLLRAGIVPLFERAHRHFDGAEFCLIARNSLAPLVAGRVRDLPVNIVKRGEGDVLFLNGRVRDFGNLAALIPGTRLSTVFINRGETIAVLFKSESVEVLPPIVTQKEFVDLYRAQRSNMADFETTATLYQYPWNLVEDIEARLEQDFDFLSSSFPPSSAVVHEGAWLVNRTRIFIGDQARVMPGAVIDASKGPVYIGMNTRVESHAAVYGPCYIGPNSVVLPGRITASSIGHTCRVGGEIEETVFQSYVNKYHAGFIGHSYVGSWVNFGAMTTNSDLKNNYSNITVTVAGEAVDTGSIKVGSFIGDHTKFGIGTLLNTGISIGICCNVYGGSLVADREVPSFSWGGPDRWRRYRFDKAVETARRTCARRDHTLAEAEIKQLKSVSDEAVDTEGIVVF
ncbi:MAG TPA: putative sugar nucleotidyl transferase [Acidobacteriota bacterium]|nr:putative sugar nucleotidyl transferase [Acidobacteriota bacterium]